MPKLNACPICGKQPILLRSDGYPHLGEYKYFCGTHISCGDWFLSVKQAEADWNRRTVDPKQPDLYKPTHADRIRAMTDEELARLIYSFEDWRAPDYCQRKKECDDMLDSDVDIPASDCIRCLLDWLKQPAETEEMT